MRFLPDTKAAPYREEGERLTDRRVAGEMRRGEEGEAGGRETLRRSWNEGRKKGGKRAGLGQYSGEGKEDLPGLGWPWDSSSWVSPGGGGGGGGDVARKGRGSSSLNTRVVLPKPSPHRGRGACRGIWGW